MANSVLGQENAKIGLEHLVPDSKEVLKIGENLSQGHRRQPVQGSTLAKTGTV